MLRITLSLWAHRWSRWRVSKELLYGQKIFVAEHLTTRCCGLQLTVSAYRTMTICSLRDMITPSARDHLEEVDKLCASVVATSLVGSRRRRKRCSVDYRGARSESESRSERRGGRAPGQRIALSSRRRGDPHRCEDRRPKRRSAPAGKIAMGIGTNLATRGAGRPMPYRSGLTNRQWQSGRKRKCLSVAMKFLGTGLSTPAFCGIIATVIASFRAATVRRWFDLMVSQIDRRWLQAVTKAPKRKRPCRSWRCRLSRSRRRSIGGIVVGIECGGRARALGASWSAYCRMHDSHHPTTW